MTTYEIGREFFAFVSDLAQIGQLVVLFWMLKELRVNASNRKKALEEMGFTPREAKRDWSPLK